ncbi:MAG: nucleotidyl transferase AbiEii/AbiGii toxin family protein [Chlamydiae bacterium]|nr:nucleotidyl transferase AbiEii/AbiGii toxin family protein [Chlamydiota bacterium]
MTHQNIQARLDKYKKSKVNDQTKIREILQQTALLGLERHGFFEKAAFYGGTALRILYGLDRFSEDLDFTLIQPDLNFNFSPYLEGMGNELRSFGFNMEVATKVKTFESSVVSAFMKINTLELYLSIGEETSSYKPNPDEKIKIKLEVDIDPPPHAQYESELVISPVSFYVVTLKKSHLFAGKMHALLYRAWKGRVKGRDWYDLIWYIQKKIPLSLTYMESCMKQAGNLRSDEFLDRERLMQMLQEKIETVDFESAKADMTFFIADTDKLNLWNKDYFTKLIQYLEVEK